MSFDLEIVNGDLKIKADRTISTVNDTPKLRQDILKIILIPLGSNKFHPWYGCSINNSISGKVLPDNIISQDIGSSVSQSLERLRALQIAQAADQRVSLAEIISVIENVQSGRNPSDPRQINVFVSVLSKRLSRVEEVFTIIS